MVLYRGLKRPFKTWVHYPHYIHKTKAIVPLDFFRAMSIIDLTQYIEITHLKITAKADINLSAFVSLLKELFLPAV